MLYIVTGVLYILNIVYGNKKWFRYLFFVFLVLLVAGTRGGYDTEIFYNRYVYYQSYESFTEPLFTMLVMVFNKLYIPYFIFMLLVGFFGIFSITNFVHIFCENEKFFYLFFMLYPMLLFFTQLRFFLGVSIVLFAAFPQLIYKKNKYWIKYICIVFLASMIHGSCMFFLLFLLLNYLDLKMSIIVTFIATVILSNNTLINYALSFISQIFGNDKISMMIRERSLASDQWGRILQVIIMSLVMAFILELVRRGRLGDYPRLNLKQKYLFDLSLKLDIFLVILIPLIINFSGSFSRVAYISMLFNYTSISNCFWIEGNKISRKSINLIMTLLVIVLILSYSMVSSLSFFNSTICPFFENNIFFTYGTER